MSMHFCYIYHTLCYMVKVILDDKFNLDINNMLTNFCICHRTQHKCLSRDRRAINISYIDFTTWYHLGNLISHMCFCIQGKTPLPL